MSKTMVQEVSISLFVDADISGDKSNRHIKIGLLIFINKDPIHWYSKMQVNVEASTFGAELCAVNTCVDMFEALWYNI